VLSRGRTTQHQARLCKVVTSRAAAL
jgi:hypothetical protein